MHFLSLPFQMLPAPSILHRVFLLFVISKQNEIHPIGYRKSDQIVLAHERLLVKMASGQKQPSYVRFIGGGRRTKDEGRRAKGEGRRTASYSL